MKKSYPVVGIGGLNGSGKDTIGQLLEDEFKFKFISISNILRGEAKRRGKKPTREVLRTISAEWRRKHGLGVLIFQAIEVYESKHKNKAGLAIASLRNPGEADTVHDYGGFVVWCDGDVKIRYERVVSTSRARGFEDNVTFEEFVAQEEAEMDSDVPDRLSLSGVKSKADVFIENSGKDIEEFKAVVKEKLSNLL